MKFNKIKLPSNLAHLIKHDTMAFYFLSPQYFNHILIVNQEISKHTSGILCFSVN